MNKKLKYFKIYTRTHDIYTYLRFSLQKHNKTTSCFLGLLFLIFQIFGLKRKIKRIRNMNFLFSNK
jgi:hypothetical protein